MPGGYRRTSDHLRERCSHRSIFNRHNELGKANVERTHDVSHCHPSGICLATLDARERGNRDAGIVGKIFLRSAAVATQVT